DAVVLGDFLQLVEAGDAVFGAFGIGHTVAVAGKSDDVRNAGFGGERNVFAEVFFDLGVIFDAVERVRDVAAAGIAHAADETVAARHFPFGDFEKIHGLEANVRGVFTELLERNLFIAPARNGLFDVGFADYGLIGLRPCGGGKGGHSGSGECSF